MYSVPGNRKWHSFCCCLRQMAISTSLWAVLRCPRVFLKPSSLPYHCQINQNCKPALRLLLSLKEVRKVFVNRSSSACVCSLDAIRAQRPQATRAWILSSLLSSCSCLFFLYDPYSQGGKRNDSPTMGQRLF